ncbi:MAG: hypothetical protein IPM51_11135 [Sphingobacteriaceae bacterium]|nr:hypothetical protein [Sphingobacteriaceae bacterium]
MNLKKLIPLITSLLILNLSFIAKNKDEKDPLHKRDFNLGLTEVKDGQPQKKRLTDLMSFKNGQLYSDFLKDKFGYKWVKYRIDKDSIYNDVETDSEIRYIQIEAISTDESNTTLTVNLIIEDWDIEGTIKITKNDKPKRYYDVVGREKGGKPKKLKKKDKEAEAGKMKEPPKED